MVVEKDGKKCFYYLLLVFINYLPILKGKFLIIVCSPEPYFFIPHKSWFALPHFSLINFALILLMIRFLFELGHCSVPLEWIVDVNRKWIYFELNSTKECFGLLFMVSLQRRRGYIKLITNVCIHLRSLLSSHGFRVLFMAPWASASIDSAPNELIIINGDKYLWV